MSVKKKVEALTMITYDVSLLAGTYALITAAAGLLESCIMVKFINDSDRNVTISYDGTNDHDIIRDTTEILYNFQTNAQPTTGFAQLAKGTKVYIKAAAGGTGTFYLVGYYNAQGL